MTREDIQGNVESTTPEDFIISLLPPEIERRIDCGSEIKTRKFTSREEAEEALKRSIFKNIASSVIFTLDDGSTVEVSRYLGFPIIEPDLDGGRENSIKSLTYETKTRELDQDVIEALFGLPEKSEKIKSAKLVFWLE